MAGRVLVITVFHDNSGVVVAVHMYLPIVQRNDKGNDKARYTTMMAVKSFLKNNTDRIGTAIGYTPGMLFYDSCWYLDFTANRLECRCTCFAVA